jgi:hypothetical protein
MKTKQSSDSALLKFFFLHYAHTHTSTVHCYISEHFSRWTLEHAIFKLRHGLSENVIIWRKNFFLVRFMRGGGGGGGNTPLVFAML